jgi:hypothetical protein
VDLPAQDRDLMAQHEQFDVFRAAVAGELGEHLQDLAQEQVHQRGCHALDRRRCGWADLAQSRTSQLPNRIYEPNRPRTRAVTTSSEPASTTASISIPFR